MLGSDLKRESGRDDDFEDQKKLKSVSMSSISRD
jgi:hypothetical protein